MSKVILSPFEKAVINAVDYLCENRIEMGIFSHVYELMDELGLKNSNWHKIKNGTRNLPRFKKSGDESYDWHAHIKRVLVNKYGVRPEYLDKHTGRMFTITPGAGAVALPIVNDGDPAPYGQGRDLTACLDEKAVLKDHIATLQELVSTQRKTIALLEEKAGQ